MVSRPISYTFVVLIKTLRFLLLIFLFAPFLKGDLNLNPIAFGVPKPLFPDSFLRKDFA